MKHIILILVFAIGFGILHAQENKSKRQIRKAKKEAEYSKRVSEVKDLIDRKEYKFVATQMLPSGALSQHLSYGYDLTISDNKITCYLPYFGRGYVADLNSKGPYDFRSVIKNYSIKKSKKGYLLKFEAHNKSDNISFVLEVQLNGSALLILHSDKRQSISYHGDIEEIEELSK